MLSTVIINDKQYARIENGTTIIECPILLPAIFGNISGFHLLMDDDILREFGFFPVIETESPSCSLGQVIVKTYQIVENHVESVYNIREASLSEVENKTLIVRHERDYRLTKSDWTQLPDNALNDLARAAWKKYRQELRNVTSQVGFPWVITWPTEPSEPYDGIVPDSITRYQAKAELSDIFVDVGGNSIDALTIIEQTIAAQSKPVQIAFNEASVWFRNSPMVLQLAAQFSAMFGWTDTDIDNMFRAAALRTA